MAQPPRIQFSVASILLVTTIVALALGIATWLEIPFSSPAVQGFLAAYLIFLGIWVVIRGPTMLRNLHDLQRRRRDIAMKRAALAEEVRRKRASLAENGAHSQSPD